MAFILIVREVEDPCIQQQEGTYYPNDFGAVSTDL